jgi:hypothetical protein
METHQMDYVSSLLDRYNEIFQFIINSDQYREFVYLKKKALRPYTEIFSHESESDDGTELSVVNVSLNNQAAGNIDKDDVDYIGRLLELHSLIVARVWDKFHHNLINIGEWDPKLDKVDVFHLLGGNDPVIVVPTTIEKALGVEWSQEKQLGVNRHEFFIIGVDPQLNRKDAWKQIKLSLGGYLGTKVTPRNPKKRAIRKYEALKLAREGYTFEKIGMKYGVDSSTAHRAFYRDFEDIYGLEYKSSESNRRSIPTHQLSKSCPTCNDFDSCTKLCPEMGAYVNQDKISQKDQISKKADIKIHD